MAQHAVSTSGGVARLPRGAFRRRLARIRAGASAPALDEALAAGADPWSDAPLLARACDLVARDTRLQLADALERVVWASIGAGKASLCLRVRRREVYAERERLITLAEAVRAPAPVPVAVLATLTLLVTDSASPLFVAGGREGGLSGALDTCLAAVEAPAV